MDPILSAATTFISKLMDGSNPVNGAGPFGDFDAESFVGGNLQKFSNTKGPINGKSILQGIGGFFGAGKPLAPVPENKPTGNLDYLDNILKGLGQ